ncbi:MAG: FxsA family protein [Gammaproteobacteria bacterium]
MFPVVAIIFLIIPIVEVYLLIQVGQVIGALWTIFLVVLTAVIGVWLLKIQGISTLKRAQQKMQSGQTPAREMLEGVGLLLAGAFLLTPGFFTDTVGFLLLFPPIRAWLVNKFVSNMMISGRFASQSGQPGAGFETDLSNRGNKSDVIEGVKYTRED